MNKISSYLECPCCGDVGAVPDSRGLFWDGGVSCDSETDPWLNVDCPCEGAPRDVDYDVEWSPKENRYVTTLGRTADA